MFLKLFHIKFPFGVFFFLMLKKEKEKGKKRRMVLEVRNRKTKDISFQTQKRNAAMSSPYSKWEKKAITCLLVEMI